MIYYRYGKVIEPKAALPFRFSEGLHIPPDERKEGGDNGYICGFIPISVTNCRSCRSVLSDFQGKEIAATTRDSDG